jgi:hypothetical protein
MPRFDGKPLDAHIMPLLLCQGVRNDSSDGAVRDALMRLDDGIEGDLAAAPVAREGQA